MRTIAIKTILAVAALAAAAPAMLAASHPAHAQSALSMNDIAEGLRGLETTPNINVAALRQQALARAKTPSSALNRPPIAEQLFKLPQFTVEIQFNLDLGDHPA